jgi:hypothetical protein
LKDARNSRAKVGNRPHEGFKDEQMRISAWIQMTLPQASLVRACDADVSGYYVFCSKNHVITSNPQKSSRPIKKTVKMLFIGLDAL